MAAFLGADAVPVERMTKKGLREFDCRGRVVALTVGPHEATRLVRLDLVLRHGVPAVRPDDVLSGLAARRPGWSRRRRRCSPGSRQGPLDPATGEVGDPLG